MVRHTATALTAGIAAAGGTWYLIGDRSNPAADRGSRILTPPVIPPVVEHVLGLAALLLLGAILIRAVRRRSGVDPAASAALVVLVVAGILLGGIGRMASFATIGANIGGALAVLYGLPLVGILVPAAIVLLVVGAVRSPRE